MAAEHATKRGHDDGILSRQWRVEVVARQRRWQRQHLVYRETEMLSEFTIARSRNLSENNFSLLQNVLCAGVNCALPVDRIICSHARYSAAAATQHRNTHHRVGFAANGLILPFLVLSSSKSFQWQPNSPPRSPNQKNGSPQVPFWHMSHYCPPDPPRHFLSSVLSVRPTFCSGHFPLVNNCERKLDFDE